LPHHFFFFNDASFILFVTRVTALELLELLGGRADLLVDLDDVEADSLGEGAVYCICSDTCRKKKIFFLKNTGTGRW